jgi:GT2 family glycosyltransferase
MKLAVIIPSRRLENLTECVGAVRRHEPDMPIVVVPDGVSFPSFAPGLDFVAGLRPFVYARNINLGIGAAASLHDPEGFILLNDDALLQTPGGFTALGEDADQRRDYGVISAVTNSAGNPNQYSRGSGFREEFKTLCFVCVLITARAIRRVGALDERFTAYGWEDNDFCRRTREARLKLGISENCFVDHRSLRSSFRGSPGASGDISAGAAIYKAKWGDLQ